MEIIKKIRPLCIVASTVLVSIILWDVIIRIFRIPDFLVPPPLAVLNQFITGKGFSLLMTHSLVTLYETGLGFILGIVIGVFLAILIVYSPFLQTAIYPLLVVAQVIPKLALAPLVLIWFGYGILSKVVIAFLISFFPIIVNTASGLREVEPEMIDLVTSLNATKWQVFKKIRFPNSLPHLFSGLKISITFAVIGAIVGEFVGADTGIGYLIIIATHELKTALLFAAIIISSIIGIFAYGVIVLLEKILIPWGIVEKGEVEVLGESI
jgi:NitT/TauT family transport system permease protein